MFLIPCPYCGERDETEFTYGGEAHIVRPKAPDDLTDEEWADFVFMRQNTKGVFAERWCHAAGCGKWFNMLRNTANDQILTVYRIGEPMPDHNVSALATPAGEPEIGSGNDTAKLVRSGLS